MQSNQFNFVGVILATGEIQQELEDRADLVSAVETSTWKIPKAVTLRLGDVSAANITLLVRDVNAAKTGIMVMRLTSKAAAVSSCVAVK